MKKVCSRGMMLTLGLLGLTCASLLPVSAQADEVENFYKGKRISLLIGVGPGGEYDTTARLVGRHIGKYIPGKPTIIAQNMSGASGAVMANHLFVQAPKDGSYLGALNNGLPLRQVMRDPGVQFDITQFNWIGAPAATVLALFTWHTSGIKTIADAKNREVIIGTSTRGSIHYIICAVLQEFTGANFKMVTGYKTGTDIDLALERGEIEGRVKSWSSVKVTEPHWIAENKISVLVQTGAKAPDLPQVPSLEELARNDEERQLVRLLGSAEAVGRPIVTTPNVPALRVDALRTAFDQAMKDSAFLDEAQKSRVEVDPIPISGIELQRIVEDVMKTPQVVVARAKSFVERN